LLCLKKGIIRIGSTIVELIAESQLRVRLSRLKAISRDGKVFLLRVKTYSQKPKTEYDRIISPSSNKAKNIIGNIGFVFRLLMVFLSYIVSRSKERVFL
jgi:hypothetical protein